MKTNTIITIGRQYGSAGREIGSKVAEAFGIKQSKAESARKFLRPMMRNRRTVFCILW